MSCLASWLKYLLRLPITYYNKYKLYLPASQELCYPAPLHLSKLIFLNFFTGGPYPFSLGLAPLPLTPSTTTRPPHLCSCCFFSGHAFLSFACLPKSTYSLKVRSNFFFSLYRFLRLIYPFLHVTDSYYNGG